MERWNNSELAKRVNAIEMFAINHHFPEWHGETIPQFISSALTEQLEELERWVEKYETTRGVSQSDNYQIGQNHGRQEFRNDILSYIREQKEIINKK